MVERTVRTKRCKHNTNPIHDALIKRWSKQIKRNETTARFEQHAMCTKQWTWTHIRKAMRVLCTMHWTTSLNCTNRYFCSDVVCQTVYQIARSSQRQPCHWSRGRRLKYNHNLHTHTHHSCNVHLPTNLHAAFAHKLKHNYRVEKNTHIAPQAPTAATHTQPILCTQWKWKSQNINKLFAAQQDTHRHNIRATGNKRDYRARNGSERRRRNPEAT